MVLGSGVDDYDNNLLRKIHRWAAARNKRRANYPSPINQYFKQLEFWRFFSIVATLTTGVVASRHNSNLIVSECTGELLRYLASAMFFLIVANSLQETIPEIAVVALLAGFSAVVTWFHTLVSMATLLPPTMNFVFCVGYVALILFNVYKIIKDDVREPDQPWARNRYF